MICPKCRATVDDDLVFCTNCGERLYESADASAPTIAMRDSVVTQVAAPPSKKSSPLKWLALVFALIVLPAGLTIAYFSLKNQPAVTTSANRPVAANRKTETNATRKNANGALNNTPNASADNANSASADNANANKENASGAESKVVFDEQIEIVAGEHIAYPFTIEADAKIVGKLETLRGDETRGFVFTQASYDEHFPDATFKTFSFDGKNPEIEQLLVKGEYVLIFVNETKSANVVKGKVRIEPNE